MDRLEANWLGPAGLQNHQELLSLYSEIVSLCTYVPFKFRNERNAVPNQDERAYTGIYSVHTSTYHFMTLKYVQGTVTS
jgi:hypothetical protein